MRKLILICLLILPSYAMAQDTFKIRGSRAVGNEGSLSWYFLDVWPHTNSVLTYYGDTLSGDAMMRHIADQDVAANAAKPSVKPEDKKTPETFSIPDARKDKVKLLQQDVEIAALRMKEIERLYKEQQDFQKAAMDKWQIELMSAMKLAGVDEKDYATYEYNRETMMFIKKKVVEEKPKTP